MNKIVKYFLIALALAISFPILFLTYATITAYNPDKIEVLEENNTADIISDTALINLMTWNIGYCGLNAEMDFFYGGGKQVYPENDVVINNINGVKRHLKNNEYVDFMLLQEVDEESRRSYNTNQRESFVNLFKGHHSTFAYNYKALFVPLPISKPMGGTLSGIQTLSRKTPTKSTRYSFEGNFAWPKSLAMLTRCFMVNRYNLSSGKELLIINSHNSAYDDGGLRKAQMKMIKSFVLKEYEKGNYIIVGADWNQSPPNFKNNFSEDAMDLENILYIDENLMPEGWTWFYDNSEPTDRRNSTPYTKGKTLTTVIDFFLLSPNIEGVSIKNLNQFFKYSDHQAVKASVKLIPTN